VCFSVRGKGDILKKFLRPIEEGATGRNRKSGRETVAEQERLKSLLVKVYRDNAEVT